MEKNELMTKEEQALTTGSFEIKDFEKQKAWLTQNLKKYQLPEVNEDTYATAKSYRALLNKVSKELYSRRISAQKAYMEPFNKGKEQYDELIGMIDEASNRLREGIEQIDNQYKEQKKTELKQYFDSANTYPIDFSQVMDAKWLNKNTKMEDAKKEIDGFLLKVNNDLWLVSQSIKNKDFFKVFCYFYFKTLNIEQSLNDLGEYIKEEDQLNKVVGAFVK